MNFSACSTLLLLLCGPFSIYAHHAHGHDEHAHDHDHDHVHEESPSSVAAALPSSEKRVEHVEVGDHCDLASAPQEPDGSSWQIVEKDVEKICAPGSTCRNGACNCDDLPDGTAMGISQDSNGNRVCRRLAGQKCNEDGDCFQRVQCQQGVCTCPQDVHCQSAKNDVYILD